MIAMFLALSFLVTFDWHFSLNQDDVQCKAHVTSHILLATRFGDFRLVRKAAQCQTSVTMPLAEMRAIWQDHS